MRAVPHHRLEVWLARLPAAPAPASWLLADESVLSADERVRRERFVRASDGDLFAAAHVLVRTTLSRYADIAPGEWTFANNAHGRPEITNANAPVGLRCNLSHTDGLVAVVVHDSLDAGVDVERAGRLADLDSVARTVFADVELAGLRALPEVLQQDRFYHLWTLKEAFIKAKGMGLALPLKDFWFSLEGSGAIPFDCVESVDPEPDAWTFTVGQPTPEHMLATACRSGRDQRSFAVDLVDVTDAP